MLKDKVIKDPILKEVDPKREFEVYIDALNNAIGRELT
jgi:hypothetical protein